MKIVDMCRSEEGIDSEDTEVCWEGFDGWIAEYEDEKEQVERTIERFSGRNPTELAYTWGSQTTVAQALASAHQELEQIEATIAKIKLYSVTEPDLKVARVNISYHSPLNDIVGDMISRNILKEVSFNDV
jgi:hypothetical protein